MACSGVSSVIPHCCVYDGRFVYGSFLLNGSNYDRAYKALQYEKKSGCKEFFVRNMCDERCRIAKALDMSEAFKHIC
jgi:hypothetical protein